MVGLVLLIVAFEDSIGRQHFLVHVAEEGKLHADLLGERGVGGGRIDANSENFCIRGINLSSSDSRLDRLELLGSTTGKGENVNGEEDVLLAAVVAEFDGLPLIAEEGEVRCGITDFQADLGDFVLGLGGCGWGDEYRS